MTISTNDFNVSNEVKINGKKYTVSKIDEFTVELLGARGSSNTMVQNKSNPLSWSIFSNRTFREFEVTSVEF